jgi:hypothetical protein
MVTPYVRRAAAYWRTRAEEARRHAEQVDENDRMTMLNVADVCDDLAKQEERPSRQQRAIWPNSSSDRSSYPRPSAKRQ